MDEYKNKNTYIYKQQKVAYSLLIWDWFCADCTRIERKVELEFQDSLHVSPCRADQRARKAAWAPYLLRNNRIFVKNANK